MLVTNHGSIYASKQYKLTVGHLRVHKFRSRFYHTKCGIMNPIFK